MTNIYSNIPEDIKRSWDWLKTTTRLKTPEEQKLFETGYQYLQGIDPDKKVAESSKEEEIAESSTGPEKPKDRYFGDISYSSNDLELLIQAEPDHIEEQGFLNKYVLGNEHVLNNRSRYLLLGGVLAAAGGVTFVLGGLTMAGLGLAATGASFGAAAPAGVGLCVGGAASNVIGAGLFATSFLAFKKSWQTKKQYNELKQDTEKYFLEKAQKENRLVETTGENGEEKKFTLNPEDKTHLDELVKKAWTHPVPEKVLLLEKINNDEHLNTKDKEYLTKLQSLPLAKFNEAYDLAITHREKYGSSQSSYVEDWQNLLKEYTESIKANHQEDEDVARLIKFLDDSQIALPIRLSLAEFILAKEKKPEDSSKSIPAYDPRMIQKLYDKCSDELVQEALVSLHIIIKNP